jgi:hypothetical protein
MALPTNAVTTYATIGNREDLEDIIYRIDPTETPFMNMVSKGKAKAVNHEWQTQALASPNTSNAVLEGDDATTDAVTPTVRLGNICQISDKVARVTGTQQAVVSAGRDNEMSYQKVLKGVELKRDLEAILVGTNQAKNAGAAATARTSASILSWIKTNNSSGATGAAPVTADGAVTRTDGNQRAFTEALLKPVLMSIWTEGGDPGTIMVGGFNKQQFSTFTGRSTPQENSKEKKIVNSVDFYESDFGKQSVTPNRFMRTRDCLILDMEYWGVDYLRNMTTVPLAKTGDSERWQIICEYTLVSKNEKASGIVADLTTS